jgi:hypothetical protein
VGARCTKSFDAGAPCVELGGERVFTEVVSEGGGAAVSEVEAVGDMRSSASMGIENVCAGTGECTSASIRNERGTEEAREEEDEDEEEEAEDGGG